MPYTISDWVRMHALICVRVPTPAGDMRQCWLPIEALTGETGAPDWLDYRTHAGDEARDFWYHIASEDAEPPRVGEGGGG